MDDEWLGALGAKLDDTGRPDTEAVFRQLVGFGADYINAPHLESIIRKTTCLDVTLSIRRRSTLWVLSTFHNDEVFELDAVETAIKHAALIEYAFLPLGPDTDSRSMIPMEDASPHQLTADWMTHGDELVFEG